LIELSAQLGDGSTQAFQLRAVFVAQLDAPIPRLIRLAMAAASRSPGQLLRDEFTSAD
jgi:hypothetical protein